ncbi:hypothetical protein L3Y34_006508 [Caenorhabditis briggsae]|uniref:Serpentine Receptor, class BC (Class B-like) n=1 Tax=Caenorhabditis briggsae TaxID=6238 RepID=A0AAE9CZM7_CAEBR|nr:hypothetical protein L3Y34_006508 [Caenorhabditis briggsae]
MHFCVGTLSVLLCFRLFVWNNCSHSTNNQTISRATRISLLDSFIIFVFDLLPIFLMSNFPEVNFRSVGPLSALCKNFGFVIESIITCGVLIVDVVYALCSKFQIFTVPYFPMDLSIFLSLFVYAIFEQIILFKFCQFEIDIPTSCLHLGCSVNKCYHDYWLWFEQIGYFSIGLSSGVLCFRLFVWSRLSKNQTNKRISRTTRISLLDTVIIFAFDILPSFLFTHFPAVNFETVGPLSALCKNFGFVIEAIIICKVLIGKNGVAPINTSKYTPNAS